MLADAEIALGVGIATATALDGVATGGVTRGWVLGWCRMARAILAEGDCLCAKDHIVGVAVSRLSARRTPMPIDGTNCLAFSARAIADGGWDSGRPVGASPPCCMVATVLKTTQLPPATMRKISGRPLNSGIATCGRHNVMTRLVPRQRHPETVPSVIHDCLASSQHRDDVGNEYTGNG